MVTLENKQFIDEFKSQWRSMWRNRVDDKMRAEGIADKDYTLLFVDRGTVIIATQRFKLLDFYETLQQHRLLLPNEIPPNPSVGGWRKFIKTSLARQDLTKRGRQIPKECTKHSHQQLKKGGRGWLHLRR